MLNLVSACKRMFVRLTLLGEVDEAQAIQQREPGLLADPPAEHDPIVPDGVASQRSVTTIKKASERMGQRFFTP